MGENIREIALDSLIEILENDKLSHEVIGSVLKKYQYLEKKERAFYSRLIQGTLERLLYIDYVIDSFSKTKVAKMKPLIRNDIRIAVYQIIYMDSVPDSAACNEAVKLAVKRGFGGLRAFVNGVLRNIARNHNNVSLPDINSEFTKHLSIKYSMPEWIVKMWNEQYGKDITLKMLEDAVTPKYLTVRVSGADTCDDNDEVYANVMESLTNQNITVEKGEYLKEALRISDYDYVGKIDAFRKGLIYIQDESSMLVAHAAGIKEGDYVIDVCAAPGGKALHCSQMCKESGVVDARDLTLSKVEKINENISRCNIKNVKTKAFDALLTDEECISKADVVIADLPCSGLGVMGQKADIKYKTSEDDVKELAKLQRQILSVVKEYVKPGGTLIYSTCTVNEYENYDNVKWFLDNSDFNLDSLNSYIPEQLHNDDTKKGYLRLFPGVNKCDGFFIARFVIPDKK